MSNAIAEQYRNVLYTDKYTCEAAISVLTKEQEKITKEISQLQTTKKYYETNVIAHLSNALSQMEEQVETRIRKAKEILGESYSGSTPGVIQAKDELDKSNNSINTVKHRIIKLSNIVKANERKIDELISKWQEEECDVRNVLSMVYGFYYKF